MFITGFVTRIKCAFRDKEMIFWTLLFPVMLATLFYFCFSNLDSADAFSPVKTAVVADQDYRQAAGFQAALEEVSKEGRIGCCSLPGWKPVRRRTGCWRMAGWRDI